MAAIAKAADVSVSTVSRALSGAAGVSAAKRAQILEIARSIGYLVDDGSRDERRPARSRAGSPRSSPSPTAGSSARSWPGCMMC